MAFYLSTTSGGTTYYANVGASETTSSGTVFYYINAGTSQGLKTIQWTQGGSGTSAYLQTTIGSTTYYLNIHSSSYKAILWPVNSNDSKISVDFTATTGPNIKHTARNMYLDIDESSQLYWDSGATALWKNPAVSSSSAYYWTYDSNGGEFTGVTQWTTVTNKLTITSTEPTKNNAIFLGWALNGDTTELYQPGETITTIVGMYNNTLTAQWESILITTYYAEVYFINALGSPSTLGPYSYEGTSSTFTLRSIGVSNPTYNSDYYTFKGWYNTSGTKISLDESLSASSGGITSYTFYAQWDGYYYLFINRPDWYEEPITDLCPWTSVLIDGQTVSTYTTSETTYQLKSPKLKLSSTDDVLFKYNYQLIDSVLQQASSISLQYSPSFGNYTVTTNANTSTLSISIPIQAFRATPAVFSVNGVKVLGVSISCDYTFTPYVLFYNYYGTKNQKRYFNGQLNQSWSFTWRATDTSTLKKLIFYYPSSTVFNSSYNPQGYEFQGWSKSAQSSSADIITLSQAEAQGSSAFTISYSNYLNNFPSGNQYVQVHYEAWKPPGFSMFINSISFFKDSKQIGDAVTIDPPLEVVFEYGKTTSQKISYEKYIPDNLDTTKDYYYFMNTWKYSNFAYDSDVTQDKQPDSISIADSIDSEHTLSITITPKENQSNFTLGIMLSAQYEPRKWKATIVYDRNNQSTSAFPSGNSSITYEYGKILNPTLDANGYQINTNGSCTIRVPLSNIIPIATNSSSDIFYTFSSWDSSATGGGAYSGLPGTTIDIIVLKDETKNPSEKSIKLYAQWTEGGIVYIFVEEQGWKKAIPYIYAPNDSNDSSPWKITQPYIYNNSTWKQTTV